MAEKNMGERESKTESFEEQKHRAFIVAQDRVSDIQEQIDHVRYVMGEDEAGAEKIISERFASEMAAAVEAEKQAHDEWLKVKTERGGGEGEPKTESLEEQKYKAMLAAQAEEDRLMGEMDKTLETAEDRIEAERKILRELMPRIDEARRVAWQAYKEWEGAMKEAIAAHEREMVAWEKEMGK